MAQSLQSVDRVVGLLASLAERSGTLSEVSGRVGLSDATALRYLGSLVEHGLVERDPGTLEYRLGLRMFAWGRSALGGRDFMTLASERMVELVEHVGETVNLGAVVGDDLVVVHAVESPQPIRKGASIGDRDSWHTSGLGKAILAWLAPQRRSAVIADLTLTPLTQRTISSVQALEDELAGVRASGFAVDDEESTVGLRCVGVPIRGADGQARYALSVSGPCTRIQPGEFAWLGEKLGVVAQELEAILGYSGQGQQSA